MSQPANPQPQTLTALLRIAHQQINEGVYAALAEAGYDDLQPAYRHVFPHIALRGARLTEIAENARLTKQAVGYLVDALEQRGYVERVPDPGDRRAKIIRFTERGRAMDAVAMAVMADIERQWGNVAGAANIAQMRRTLEELEASFQQPS